MQMRRVVITGLGVIAPNGIGIDPFWDSLVHGESGVKRITEFDVSSYPSQIAGIVSDFDATEYMDPKTAKRLSRFAQFALAASRMAVEDSGIDFSKEDPYRAGVSVGTAIGGGDVIETQLNIFMEKGIGRIAPFAVVSISGHSASAIISCEYKLKGPSMTVSTGCTTGLDAVHLGYNSIRIGDTDVVVAGTGESPITPYSLALFSATGLLSKANEEPQKALKPYDADADGMVLGEGGGTIILEELQHALSRDAKIYGEVVGYSALNEAYDLVSVDPSNETMALSFRMALKRGNLDLREIDYINAHGNGIVSYDISETEAIKNVFGEWAYHIPVTSIKPVTGHSLSSTSMFQIISSLLAIQNRMVPPTINISHPAPHCDLNYVRHRAIERELQTVLINAHGFGGRLATLVVRKYFPEG